MRRKRWRELGAVEGFRCPNSIACAIVTGDDARLGYRKWLFVQTEAHKLIFEGFLGICMQLEKQNFELCTYGTVGIKKMRYVVLVLIRLD